MWFKKGTRIFNRPVQTKYRKDDYQTIPLLPAVTRDLPELKVRKSIRIDDTTGEVKTPECIICLSGSYFRLLSLNADYVVLFNIQRQVQEIICREQFNNLEVFLQSLSLHENVIVSLFVNYRFSYDQVVQAFDTDYIATCY